MALNACPPSNTAYGFRLGQQAARTHLYLFLHVLREGQGKYLAGHSLSPSMRRSCSYAACDARTDRHQCGERRRACLRMQRNKRPSENGRRGKAKQNKAEVKRSKMRGGGESVCGADERDGLVIVARQAREADVIFGISGRNFRAVPETRSALATSRVVCCCTRPSLTAF